MLIIYFLAVIVNIVEFCKLKNLNETFFCQAEKEDVCYGIKKKNDNLNYSKLNCTQQLPLVCVKQNGKYNLITTLKLSVAK